MYTYIDYLYRYIKHTTVNFIYKNKKLKKKKKKKNLSFISSIVLSFTFLIHLHFLFLHLHLCTYFFFFSRTLVFVSSFHEKYSPNLSRPISISINLFLSLKSKYTKEKTKEIKKYKK